MSSEAHADVVPHDVPPAPPAGRPLPVIVQALRSARHDRPLPFVVELVGTPGAGKTTLARDLLTRLRLEGFQPTTIVDGARAHAARTRTGRLVVRHTQGRLRRFLLWQTFFVQSAMHAVAFARERPELVRHVVRRELRRPTSAAMKRHTLYWFVQLAGRSRFLAATAVEGEAIVVDDGFVHRAVALHASHLERPDAAAIAAYVDLLPEPDTLVHVTAPVETCERRVRERGIWDHSKDLTPLEVSRFIRHADRTVAAAVGRARELGWMVVEVENPDRPATATAPVTRLHDVASPRVTRRHR